MNLGETIYYLRNDKLHSAPILSKIIVENANDDWDCNEEQKEIFTRFGKAKIAYSTCHGEINDREAFKTPEALFAHLLKVGK